VSKILTPEQFENDWDIVSSSAPLKEWQEASERLIAHDAALRERAEKLEYGYTHAMEDLKNAKAHNARLLEALKPLAALAEHYEDDPRMGIVVVTIGHDRVRLSGHDAHVAAAALAGGEEEK
jgi:hypothetical protein